MTIFKKSRIRERYRSAAGQERQEVERAARAGVGAASQRTKKEERAHAEVVEHGWQAVETGARAEEAAARQRAQRREEDERADSEQWCLERQTQAL
jgi:hypothetical protein